MAFNKVGIIGKRLRLKGAELDALVSSRFLARRRWVRLDGKRYFSMRNFGYSTRMRSDTFWMKEPETLSWIRAWPPNQRFLDVGASVGIYSLFAAKLGHEAVAFEPSALNYAVLNLNILDNLMSTQISAYPFSADSELSLATLNLNSPLDWGGGGSSFGRQLDWKGQKVSDRIPQSSLGVPIDWFCHQTGFWPNYIKIDVDGNELLVIKGAIDAICNKECKGLLIELWPEHSEFDEIMKLIVDAGFRVAEVGESEMFRKACEFSQNFIFTR